jgi:hypothetical protein
MQFGTIKQAITLSNQYHAAINSKEKKVDEFPIVTMKTERDVENLNKKFNELKTRDAAVSIV